MPIGQIYQTLSQLRNKAYDVGIKKTFKVSCPVVSVGNITTGGTGKTPVIDHFLTWAHQNKILSGVISRGYKRHTTGVVVMPSERQTLNPALYGDEPTMLGQSHPEVPIVLGEKRVEAAIQLLESFDVNLIFADDAFQHRALDRDLDIVVIDATEELGRYRSLPLGRAREPLKNLNRAHHLILTKSNLVSGQQLEKVKEFVNQYWSNEIVASESVIRRVAHPNSKQNLSPGQEVTLVSGIGRPGVFEKMIKSMDYSVTQHLSFPDHHDFTEKDIRGLNGPVVTTAKDYVKLCKFKDLIERLYVAELELSFDGGIQRVYEDIKNLV